MRNRSKGKTTLPNGAAYSRFSVSPNTWETPNADVTRKWTLSYRYYSNDGISIIHRNIAGDVNRANNLIEKQGRMRRLIALEHKRLREGFVPGKQGEQIRVKKSRKKLMDPSYPVPNQSLPIEPDDSFKDAVLKFLANPPGSPSYQEDVRTNCIRVLRIAKQLSMDMMPVSLVSKKHMRRLFVFLYETEGISDERFNRVRSHMQLAFKEFMNQEANENDPMFAVPKKVVLRKKQPVLTIEEIQQILAFLKPTDYPFYRFCYIFYHSGSRPMELCRIKKEEVLLDQSLYMVTILKGQKKKQVLKPIHQNVLSLWRELCALARPGQYIFSDGFIPGNEPHITKTYVNRFISKVKNVLGITANFYTMKHRKLSEVRMFMMSQEGTDLAKKVTQAAASHESFRTTESHYLVDEDHLMNEILKKIGTRV